MERVSARRKATGSLVVLLFLRRRGLADALSRLAAGNVALERFGQADLTILAGRLLHFS